MAQIITTGPAHVFIGHCGNTYDTLEYLGTCQKSPGITIQTLKEDVMNDIGGETPISFTNQGQVAQIKLTLNRYDEAVFAKIALGLYLDGTGNRTGSRGEITRNQMGVLAQGMEYDFHLMFYFPFHQSFVAGSSDPTHNTSHPEGIHFHSVVPTKEKLSEMGTRARMASLELKCIPKLVFANTNVDSNSTAGNLNTREFRLYENIKSLPSVLKERVN